MNNNKDTIINCPVCNKPVNRRGLKNHIIINAKQESWKNLENKPHKEYYDTNCIEVDKSKFISKV